MCQVLPRLRRPTIHKISTTYLLSSRIKMGHYKPESWAHFAADQETPDAFQMREPGLHHTVSLPARWTSVPTGNRWGRVRTASGEEAAAPCGILLVVQSVRGRVDAAVRAGGRSHHRSHSTSATRGRFLARVAVQAAFCFRIMLKNSLTRAASQRPACASRAMTRAASSWVRALL